MVIMQRERLAEWAQSLFNIILDSYQLDQLECYANEMLDWNANRANLTAITNPDEVEIKHFLDSLSLLGYLDIASGSYLADVGAGAGFPGLVLKIARPDLQVTLIESVGKKTSFLSHMIELLGLEGVDILRLRAETVGQDPDYREQFDWVVARAVSGLPTLVEYLLPLTRLGGYCVAMKGANALNEIQDAAAAIETFGGQFVTMHSVPLPDVLAPHILVVMNKIRYTPAAFPRRDGIPAKRPVLADEE